MFPQFPGARPVVGLYDMYRVFCKTLPRSSPWKSCRSAGKMLSVRSAEAAAWLEHIDAEVEVGPELSLPDEFSEVLVGGGDDPDVDGVTFVSPPHDLLFLQHPEEPGLNGEGGVADLIQEKWSLCGPARRARPFRASSHR